MPTPQKLNLLWVKETKERAKEKSGEVLTGKLVLKSQIKNRTIKRARTVNSPSFLG
jgi:hypothetical protein